MPNMRKFLLILLIFIHKNAFCQLNDNFSDGDFTNNPAWQGQDAASNFMISDGQLRSNSETASSNFYLSTANTKALNCTWEFYCNLKFATSGANYVDIYLISNTENLKSNAINGYFVRIGNTDDEVSLYKRSGTTSTKIIDGINGSVASSTNNQLKIKVTRSTAGEFILERDPTGTGNSFVNEGVVLDNTFTTGNWFGILIQQSVASFHKNHFFDNFVIKDIELDVTPPALANFVIDSNKITLTFDELVNSTDAAIKSHYLVNPGSIEPGSVTVEGKVVTLNFEQIFPNGDYTFSISTLQDPSGNTISTPITRTFNYTKPIQPGTITKHDILINEVLFNPRTGGVDFVEVYNNTNKTFDFKDLSIANANDKDSLTIRAITSSSVLCLPGTYWVLTANPDNIKAEYFTSNPNNFIKVSSMPSYNNDKGVVVLVDKDKNRIDQFNYTEKMHFPLLKEVKGVSLERRYFNEDTNKPGNFGSAAESVGFATPAYKNSQYLVPSDTDEVISFSSKTFSPDNDGFEDILTINYNLNETGYVANVTVYDDNGRLVKKLVSNETVSSSGSWLWDGLNLDSNKLKAGIYIAYFEFFNLTGEVKKFKKAIILASKFN